MSRQDTRYANTLTARSKNVQEKRKMLNTESVVWNDELSVKKSDTSPESIVMQEKDLPNGFNIIGIDTAILYDLLEMAH